MRSVLFLFLSMLFVHGVSSSLHAQDKTITGKVNSAEGELLSFATVVLLSLPDSTHIAFTTTNRNGNYTLNYQGAGEAFVQASHIGFVTQRQPLRLDRAAQTVDFTLEVATNVLTSAVVNARMLGASVRGDTVIYNLSAYTDHTERVLKDILDKLPGIEVDENGKVKAQGVPIKVLIDGKEFFFDQSQMATKNVPANMVGSVELIHNYSDIGMLKGSAQPQGITVLNVGIKDEFKGKVSGVLMGGGGVVSNYSGQANLFRISKNMTLASIFDANNTGEMAFTLNDYLSFQRGVSLARGVRGNRVTYDATDVPIRSFSDDVMRKEGQTGALNLSYRHPNNKLKMNSYLIANHQKQLGESVTRRWASTDFNSHPVSIDGLMEQNRFSFYTSYLSLDYQPANRFFISNRSMIGGQEIGINRTVSRQLQTTFETLRSDEKMTTFDVKDYLLAMYNTKGGNILSFDGYYRYINKPSILNFASADSFLGLPFASSKGENQAVQKNRQNAHELSLFGEYAYKMGSFFLRSIAGFNYLQQYYNPTLFQWMDGAEMLFMPEQHYTNTLHYNHSDLWAGLWLQRNVGIMRLALGADIHRYSTTLNNISHITLAKEQQWKLLPNAQLTVYLSATHQITASVNCEEEARRITDLNESKVARSYRTLAEGKVVDDLLNPHFSASFRYHHSNFRKGRTISFNSRYANSSSPLTSNVMNYPNYTELKSVESPVSWNITSMFNFRQSLMVIPFDITARITHTFRSSFSYINGAENELNQHSLNADLGFMTFTKGKLNGDLGGNIVWVNHLSKLMERTTRLFTLAPYLKLRANPGKGWIMKASVQHFKYDANDTRRDITNLSASIVYVPQKSRFEFELIANNILNFNKTEKVTSNYALSFFEERVLRTLPGFLMGKVVYRL